MIVGQDCSATEVAAEVNEVSWSDAHIAFWILVRSQSLPGHNTLKVNIYTVLEQAMVRVGVMASIMKHAIVNRAWS